MKASTSFISIHAREFARVLVLLILLLGPTMAAGEGLSLRSVYKLKLPAPESGTPPYARFDTTGERVSLIESDESQVRLINWRREQEVYSRRYAEVPCADSTPGMHAIGEWEPLNNGLILMRYCGSLYFLDSETLSMKHKLEQGEEHFGEASFSPNGRHMAVVVGDASWTWDKRQIRIYELATLAILAEWPVTHLVTFLSFASDGRSLVARVDELERPLPEKKVYRNKACRLISWRTDTWEVDSEKAFAKGGERGALDCPWRPRPIPGHNVFLDDGPVRIRDLRSGAVLKTIQSDGVLLEVAASHNGRWVAATVKTNWPPDMGRAFRILDLHTGNIVYQKTIVRRDTVPVAFSWSPEDRYLLVSRPGEIEIYEIKQ